MNPNTDETYIGKSLRRHVVISAVSAVAIVSLALLRFASPGVVMFVSIVLASAICFLAMHLYRERKTVQAVIAFTVFFIVAMVGLIFAAVDDLPHGAELIHYDHAAEAVDASEAH